MVFAGSRAAAAQPSLTTAQLVASITARADSGATADSAREADSYAFYQRRTTTTDAGEQYRAGPLRAFFLGDEYRDVWGTQLEVPVIDLERTAGGLTPFRRGGGLQTTSLHLWGGDGHHYVLRSVDKRAARSLPDGYHDTIVADVAQDQTSAMNPYAAFILPPLAEAAGVLHTEPTLVVIPDSPALGEYRGAYAGMLALFERKPDEDQSDAPRFGRSENIVGSAKLFEKTREDNDDRVDERAYARARLFDMLIGDWDRHDEQWRWAEFEGEHGTRFVAVPRDRDFAFAKFDGLLLQLGRKTNQMALRKLTNFDAGIDNLLGLNWQGSKLDLRLTASLDRDDWIEIARDLQDELTDAEIDAAVRTWPDAVYERVGPFTAKALKSRRDQLPRVADRYYEMLAHTVDVVGTDKHERFEVTHLNDREVQVLMYKTYKEGDVVRELYRRTFHRDETDEIRLYGLGGRDRFVFGGEGASGIRVRAIGGEGEDAFVDRSAVPGRHYLYDTRTGNAWDVDEGTHVERSHDPAINRYEMHRFAFDRVIPAPAFDFDSDDGIFVGGGIRLVKPGFRKKPYAASHTVWANYAPRSSAFNVGYDGDVVGFRRGWNAALEAELLAASNFRSFYGLGNESDEDARFRHQARLRRADAGALLYRRAGASTTFGAGPQFSYVSVSPLDDMSGSAGFASDQLTERLFAGLRSSLVVDTRDSTLYPRSGIRWENEAGVHVDLRDAGYRYGRLASALSLYHTLPFLRPVTLVLRVGGATNLGDFAFYQANALGGNENLRGFGTTRFAGHGAVFGNLEARIPLAPFNVYLTRGTLGVLAFVDTGRVWAQGEQSRRWHVGYGGGLWATPFEQFLVTTTAGFSREGAQIDLSFGFLF